MVWSAGQREFVPLLLGLYWLLPPAKIARRGSLEWVVIEEMEMGLHPRAVATMMLLVLELLARGYRVCLSTHSPQVLEMIWALQELRAGSGKAEDLLDLFAVKKSAGLVRIAAAALKKQAKVYAFEQGQARDISALDPFSEDAREADWGGLTAFSERASRIVARAANARNGAGHEIP